MDAIIKKLAQALVDVWNSLPGWIQWSIEQVGGTDLVTAIKSGVAATIDYLSNLASWIIDQLISLIGSVIGF